MSTVEENKKIAVHRLDLIRGHKVEELGALTAPDWTMHDSGVRDDRV
ncbi:MAG: hypothetical protein ACRDTC_22845 [Pseudonocardiaceae bacterium]